MNICVRFLKDYHGAEFPPAPARLFQALVNGLYDQRNVDAKVAVLSWLEQLPAPEILASPANHEFSSLVNYQPDNDDNYLPDEHGIIHERSGGQSLVRYILPPDGVVIYRWPDICECPDGFTLRQLVKSLRFLGRTEDLVLASVAIRDTELAAGLRHFYPSTQGVLSLLAPQKGFWDACRLRYPRQRSKFILKRKLTKKITYSLRRQIDEVPIAVFDILNRSGLKRLDFAPWQLRRLAGIVRGTLIQKAQALQLEEARLHRLVRGHHENGLQHFAVAPIPSINDGWDADGRLRRVAILGYGINEPEDRVFFDTLMPEMEDAPLFNEEMKIGTLHVIASLRELGHMKNFFAGKSKCFRSMTPVVLTNFNNRATRPISACLGLSAAELEEVDSVTAYRGPILPTSEYPMKYQVADYLAKWPRVHLEICYKEEHSGPLLLGRGRYVGFGLMMPV
jgi:CRISPR-associated protein Csb2